MALKANTVIAGETIHKPLLERHKKQNLDNEQQPSTRINCEQVTLIWLDHQIGQTSQFSDDIHFTEQTLRQLNDYVLLFSSDSDCLDHVESIKNETVLLVMAGSCASPDVLEKMHKIRQVDSIFIFCQKKNVYESLLSNKDYYKLFNVFDEQTSLESSIARAIEQIDKQSAIFALYNPKKQKSTRDLTRESGSFIFLQLAKQLIQKMLPNQYAISKSKKEMLDKCRLYYRGNKKEMENIAKFEDEYTSDQAIKWYTNDSFIYKLINKALRTEDIDALYTYRFYIIDLCACLAENCRLLREWVSKIKVYRGIKLPKVEIERLCGTIGGLIAANGYFSTSRKRCVSKMFAGIGVKVTTPSNSDVLESVLFDIEVDLEKYSEIILADVRHISSHKDEDEVLFDLGTVFKINAMSYNDKGHYWACSMSATDEGRAIAKEYLHFREKELDNSDDIEIAFGDLLFEMGEWLKSRIYFGNLLHQRPNDPHIYFGIGQTHRVLTEMDQALFYFKHAYDLSMCEEHESNAFAAKICCSTLRLYHDICNFNQALAFGREALELYKRAGEHDHSFGISQVLINIGLVYFDQGNDSASLEHLERAFRLLKNIYSFDHPEISRCLNHLAFAHYHNADYEKALDSLLKSAQIDERLLPPDHPDTYALENNIGKQYYKQGKYQEALQKFRRASTIVVRTSSDCSERHIVVLNNIGKALYRLNNIDEAALYYEKAMDLIEKIFSQSPNHIYLAYTMKNKGELSFALGNLVGALELFERAHTMYEHMFGRDSEHRDIAKCKHLIGLTHLALGDLEKAAKSLGKALTIWINVLPQNHHDLALCHQSMGELYMRLEGEGAKVIAHFQSAISIYEKRPPVDSERLRDLKSKLVILENRYAAIV
jgi:tetratricopeptide (TPR) repeat protein